VEIAIIGGGIVGVGLALNLHQRGLSDQYKRVARYRIEDLAAPSKA
jgi:glycine/D-amino acid oxidase-like deaminating enzyme